MYVAFSRIAVGEAACGSDGTIDVGVYVRSRNQPDGAWSLPVRIGSPNDRLDTFRVDGQTMHAVVNGGTYYETGDGPTLHRYPIPQAMPVFADQHGPFGRSSMRVGSDGRARILYETGSGLRYGVFTGAGFSTSRIPGTTERDVAPLLVLGVGDQPHLLWTRLPVPPSGGGCAGDEPRPKDHGALYATNTRGAWKVSRVTPDVGETSLQVDERTGTIHVLVSARSELRHYTSVVGGPWRGSRVTSARMTSPLLRLDPATGGLLVVYLGGPGGTRIYSLTKP